MELSREKKIETGAHVLLTGFLLSSIYSIVLSIFFHKTYPYDTFLFRRDDVFGDYTNLVVISNDPYAVLRGWPNFPVLYKILSAFNLLPVKIGLFLFLSLFVIFFVYVNWKNLKEKSSTSTFRNVFVYSFLTYPFLIAIDRANLEIFVFMCLYFFIFYYKKHPIAASIALSLAIALKAFPVIFAFIFFIDKKYKYIIWTGLTTALITFAAYATMPGGFLLNLKLHLENLRLYNINYGLQNNGLMFGNSLLGGIKFILISIKPKLADSIAMATFIEKRIEFYYVISLVFLIIVLVYIYFFEKKFWRTVTLLVFSLNLLPLVSGDYKLLHIFLPFFLFVNDDSSTKMDPVFTTLFCLLLIPKNFYHLPQINEVNLGVIANPILMLLIIMLIVLSGMLSHFKGHKE